MLASVIIPAHNAANTIALCLEGCLNQTHADVEVIVVDDGSTDDTSGIARSFPVSLIRQEQSGPAAARNRGAKAAKGDVFVFTDSDCVPDKDWIENLLERFDEGVVGVGGTYGNAIPESLLACMIQEEIAFRHDQFGDRVDFLGSFNVAYGREAFEAAGGFDESFTSASAEDNDLAYRLADNGGDLRFVKNAIVAHFHPTSLARYLKAQMRHGFWRVKLYVKHPHRTAKGDRYAGLADLAAPPLSIALLVGWMCWAAAFGVTCGARWTIALGLLWLVASSAYVAMRATLPMTLWKRTGRPSMLLFLGVAALRDVARGIGLAKGLWHFRLLRRTTY